MNSQIRHIGFVKEVKGQSMVVNILNQSACSACHAKGACTVADFQEKEIEIQNFTNTYQPGQQVTVVFTESQGFTALFFGYVLPFILVLATLIISLEILNNELTGGLISLAILIPYYLILWIFRHKLKKLFKFEVQEN